MKLPQEFDNYLDRFTVRPDKTLFKLRKADWTKMHTDKVCPHCWKPLKYLRNEKGAYCKRKGHPSFFISMEKLK